MPGTRPARAQVLASSPAADVVRAAADGDPDAWRAIVTRYEGLVHAGARRVRGLNEEDYEDAVATTWLRLVDDIGHIRDHAAIGAWLRTTSYRESLRIARSRRRPVTPVADFDGDVLGWEPDFTAEIHRREVRAAILGVVSDLSPMGRRLLIAFLDDPDASYRDIEARCGVGVSSIGPIRRRVFHDVERALTRAGVVASGRT